MTVVRPLIAADRAAWEPLWAGYLEFYEHELPASVTDETFGRLVERRESMAALVADDGGRLLGFAHVLQHASTWAPEGYVYLEDLFVAPAARGGGVATALIGAVVELAGGRKVYWHTRADNNPARRLYDRLGTHDGFIVYELPAG